MERRAAAQRPDGRAILAADQASHPQDGQERRRIREEFVRRHMAEDTLEVETNVVA